MSESKLDINAITLNEVGGVELADEALQSLAEDADIVVAGGADPTDEVCVDAECPGGDIGCVDIGCSGPDTGCVDIGCHLDWWYCS